MGFLSVADMPVDVDKFQEIVLESLTDGVYFVDRHRRILYWNRAAEELTGYKADQVLGCSCADGILMHVDGDGRCLCKEGCPLEGTMQDGRSRDTHVFLHHANGHRVPVHVRGAAIRGYDGNIVGSVEVFSDDSHHVEILDRVRELEQAALIDELTGLANRRYFNRAIRASLTEYQRHHIPFGILMADIDHFKRFNDFYEHEMGDRVLQIVAKTLTLNCRAYDTPVRWGGEEFVVLVEKCEADQLRMLAERTRNLIATSVLEHDGMLLNITVSIGGSLVQPNDDVNSIVQRADSLLYRSKKAGRNCVMVY